MIYLGGCQLNTFLLAYNDHYIFCTGIFNNSIHNIYPPSYIYTHPSLHSRPVPTTPLSLPPPIYTNSTLPIYDPLPSLPLTTGTPCQITYEQTHQLPPLNATLRLIISPLPSLPLNNSLPRTADC